jgi:hypothetical protein
MLGDLYSLFECLLDPRDFGWPVSRQRRYTVLALRGTGDLVRPCSDIPATLGSEVPVGLTGELFAWEAIPTPSLTPARSLGLSGYFKAFAGSHRLRAVDLSQHPLTRPRTATAEGSLCTLTCGSSSIYLPSVRRCLTGTELLVAQGYPASKPFADILRTTLPVVALLAKSQRVRLAGNGMHAACLGAVLSWIARYGRILSSAIPSSPSLPCRLPSAIHALGSIWSSWLAQHSIRHPVLPTGDTQLSGQFSPFPLSRPCSTDIHELMAWSPLPTADYIACEAIASDAVYALDFLGAGGRGARFGPPSHLASGGTARRFLSTVFSGAQRFFLSWQEADLSGTFTPTAALSSFSCTTAKYPRLQCDKVVDLPTCASSCDPLPLLESNLQGHCRRIQAIFPRDPLVPADLGLLPRDRTEYLALILRMLHTGKVLLHLQPMGVAKFFVVAKPGDRQRPIWSGNLISDAVQRPPKPWLLGNPASFLDLEIPLTGHWVVSK